MTFEEALAMVHTARLMRDCLPNGQWDELRSIVSDYRTCYGGDTRNWDEDTRNEFVHEVDQNFLWWL